ncbi:MAG: tRNA uridine-5-carboxymethylaminomethyl(34) synthesis GTPase MnmE [Elusimicrobiales bacterium]
MNIYPEGDTIAAAATACAPGAVGVARISGPDAPRIARALARRAAEFPPRKAVLCEIADSSGKIDDVLVTSFKSPFSFTGEDVAEISCHGSPYILSRTVEAAIALGARAALPGEFTLRAWRNGKMDLAQAEGVCDLVRAETGAAHKAALNMAGGGLSARFARLRGALIDSLAGMEARLDDGDAEQEPFSGDAGLGLVAAELRAMAGSFASGRMIKQGARVAIAGAPNAGKSSLLNALAGYGRAIVSPLEGTTRDTVDEAVEICGRKFILTDTAGIREHALDPAEAEGMARARGALARCDAVVFVLDGSRPADARDHAVWREICACGAKAIIAANKSDAGGPHPAPFGPAARISCKTGEGLDGLKSLLVQSCGAENPETVITSARHYGCVRSALDEVSAALEILSRPSPPLELAAEHVRSALSALAAVTGGTAADDVLDAVFGKFCVGK